MEKLLAEIEAAKKRGELDFSGPKFFLHGYRQELGFRNVYIRSFGTNFYRPDSNNVALSRVYGLKFKTESEKSAFFGKIGKILGPKSKKGLLEHSVYFTHFFEKKGKFLIYANNKPNTASLTLKIFQVNFPKSDLPEIHRKSTEMKTPLNRQTIKLRSGSS